MPAPGTVWASGTWGTDAWAADTWADVGGGDVTAPTLSSGFSAATGATTASGSVTTDEGNGTLYWVVTQSATKPSVAQVQAGQDHTGAAADAVGSKPVSATGTQGMSVSGLTAETTYYTHFQQQDAATNDSTVVSSSSFTTTAASSVSVPSFPPHRRWRAPAAG